MMADLRAARSTDAGATGDILWRYQTATEWMPKLYSAAETLAFCGSMIDRGWVTLAVVQGQTVGFIARDGVDIHALYLTHAMIGRGVGQMLLDDAKVRSDRLCLWTYQAASGAQKFYLRHGFIEKDRTDGSDNDNHMPDVFYVWTREATT